MLPNDVTKYSGRRLTAAAGAAVLVLGTASAVVGAGAALLVLGTADAAAQVKAPTDDPFEAALRQLPAASSPATGRSTTRGVEERSSARADDGRRDKVAPAGLIPSYLRGVKLIDRALWRRAQADAERGLLDPHAFAAMIHGPLPLPPGAQPIRCRNSISRIWFTMGVDVPSAEYAQRLAEYERDGRKAVIGKGNFGTNHSFYSEKATAKMRAEIGRHLAANGWQKIPGRTSRELYMPAGADPERSMKIGVWPDSYLEQLMCTYKGVTLPTGPVIEVSFPAPPG